MTTETIVRIQKKNADEKIGTIIKKKIIDYTRYFAPTESIKPVSLMRLTKHDLSKEKHQPNQLVNVTRRAVGKNTLFEHIQQHEKRLPHRTNEIVEDFYEHLVYGLAKLVDDCHIVHFSLQPNNILYSDSQFCPIITDFGDAFVLEDLNNDERMKSIFAEPHPPGRCLEAKCISKIIKDPDWKTKEVQLETVIIELEEEETKKKWQKYISTFRGKLGKEVVSELMENWDTWDLYSVNTMFEKYLHSNTTYEPGQPYVQLNKSLFV